MKVKDVIADDIMRCKESIDEELQKSGYSHELYDQLNRLYACVLEEEMSGDIEKQIKNAEGALEEARERLGNAYREYEATQLIELYWKTLLSSLRRQADA